MSIERGQKYFPQFEGLARKLKSLYVKPSESSVNRASRLLARSDDDIMDRLDKQFSKRARRIKAAKQAGLLP